MAVAQVWNARNEAGIIGGWFGDADPTATDLAVALTWQAWPDLTGGALYAIGPGDLERMDWLEYPTGEWICQSTTETIWR